MRHAKLWLAGEAKNWKLAQYELGEIEEGQKDAAKYHPVFKEGAQVSVLLRQFTAKPINDIRQAIGNKDTRKFRAAFDALTGECNGCHQASAQGAS
jgi:hypothetical protein